MLPPVPLDVVRVVLDHLRSLCKGHEAHANGLAVALVCKDWLEDGLKLAWEEFTLTPTDESVGLFVACAPLHGLRLVRHLYLVSDVLMTARSLQQPLDGLVSQFAHLQVLTLGSVLLTVPLFAGLVAGPFAATLKALTVTVEICEQDIASMDLAPLVNGLHSLVNLKHLSFALLSKPEFENPATWTLSLPPKPKPRLTTLDVVFLRSTRLDWYLAVLVLGAFDLSFLQSLQVSGSCTTISYLIRGLVYPIERVKPTVGASDLAGEQHTSLRTLHLTFNRAEDLITSLPSLLELLPLLSTLERLTLCASREMLRRPVSADPPPTLSPETPALSLAALHDALPRSVDLVTVRGVAFVLDVKTVVEIGDNDDDGESEGLMVNEPGWAIQGCAQVWLQRLGAVEGEEGAVAREVVLLLVHADGRTGVTVLD